METKTSSLVFLQYLTTVFDNTNDAILLIGVEPRGVYRLLLANKAFFADTGFAQDVVGKRISDVLLPQVYIMLSKHCQQVVRTKTPINFTLSSEVPIGRRTYEIRLIPIINTVGDVVQIAGLNRDVTEIQHLREQVKQLQNGIVALTKAAKGSQHSKIASERS